MEMKYFLLGAGTVVGIIILIVIGVVVSKVIKLFKNHSRLKEEVNDMSKEMYQLDNNTCDKIDKDVQELHTLLTKNDDDVYRTMDSKFDKFEAKYGQQKQKTSN